MFKKLFTPQTDINRRTVRSAAVQAEYDVWQRTVRDQYGDDAPCPLCRDHGQQKVIQDFSTMMVVENDFPYNVYDGLPIVKHYMLIPKRHIATFNEFTTEEQGDYWRGYCELSAQGFGTMTQAPTSQYRSVPSHIHTHLLQY